VMEVRS